MSITNLPLLWRSIWRFNRIFLSAALLVCMTKPTFAWSLDDYLRPQNDDVCRYVDTGLQTWWTFDDLGSNFSHTFTIDGGATVESGTAEYIGYLSNKQIIFTQWQEDRCLVKVGEKEDGNPIYENRRCKANPWLVAPKPDFSAHFTGTEVVEIHEMDKNVQPPEASVTLAPGAYKKVIFHGTQQDAWLESGTYWIDRLELTGGRKLSIKSPSDGPVYLNLKTIYLGGGVAINPDGNPDDIQIKLFGSEDTNHMEMSGGSTINGLVLSENKVTINGGSTLRGALTAKQVVMNGGGYLFAQSRCIDGNIPTEPDDYTLSVTPEQSVALMCGNETPIFTINTKQDGKNASLSVNAVFNSDVDNFELSVVDSIGQGSGTDFASNRDGQLKLQVTARNPNSVIPNQDYSLTFNLTNDKSKSQTVSFRMVPAKIQAFEAGKDDAITNNAIDTLSLVAGKATKVDFKVLACSANGTPVVAENYKEQQLTWQHTLVTPSDGDKGTLTFAPQFTSGVAQSAVTLDEAGKFNLTLSDQFNCAGYQGCGDNDIWPLNGVLTLQSRPWTLAICPASDSVKLNDGTATSGEGMIGAGERFALTVRPIIWQSDSGHSGDVEDITPINTSGYCSAPVTQNVFSDQGEAFEVMLESQLHSPTALIPDYDGPFLESDNGLSHTHEAGISTTYWRFENLFWNEVGSLSVSAGLAEGDDYLGMSINPGERVLGRFYPASFSVTSNEWHYPKKGDDRLPYYYMNQPIEAVEFEVEARNASGTAATNYEHFALEYKARFGLIDLNNTGRFPTLDRYVQGDGSDVWQGGIGYFAYQRQGDALCDINDLTNTPLCWSKRYDTDGRLIEDGPYNVTLMDGSEVSKTSIGITLTGSLGSERVILEDPVKYSSQLLPDQPALRLGRAVLSSVGGAQGAEIAVPLTIEHWENGRFHTAANSQDTLPWDNYSQFDGQHHCKKAEWPEVNATHAQLAGIADVTQGQSQGLRASQSDDFPGRESVRFWLKLGTEAETSAECTENSNLMPWLQYDWDVNSPEEEDPSAVVTFGIYRGNDRVILRGENGILPN